MASRIVCCRAGQVAPAAGQQRQPVLQPGQQRRRREDLDPGRGQLDGQRQPVQPAADVGDGCGVLVGQREVGLDRLRPRDEEAHRRGRRRDHRADA